MLRLSAPASARFVRDGNPPGWKLKEGSKGESVLALEHLPFQVGRSLDCDLVLPDNEALAATTSRWHCHIVRGEGGPHLVDGSLRPVPGTGKSKPSITGTMVNGRRVSAPVLLREGDAIQIGPWLFRIEMMKTPSVDIDRMLTRLGAESGRTIVSGDPGLSEAFSQLQELFTLLDQLKDSQDSLGAILNFSLDKIRAAEVAALLVHSPAGEPEVRLAVQRGAGRVRDLNFSKGLFRDLPRDQTFLLKTRIAGDITKSQLEQDISSGLLVPLRGSQGRLGMLYMDNRTNGLSFTEKDLYLANALASVSSLQLALERQAFLARVENNMSQYFGKEVVRLIVEESAQGRPVGLGVRECEATILFFDMQGFSTFCRGKTPQDVSELLNPYFELAAGSVQRHGGHVDKFIGDGVMSVFGGQPLQTKEAAKDHAFQAFQAAREILSSWSQRSLTRWGTPIPLRAGLNSGKVVIGNIGSPGRMEYSVLGDAVNLAARMEGQAKSNGIALTDATKLLLGDKVSLEDGGLVEVKGCGKVRIWRAGGD